MEQVNFNVPQGIVFGPFLFIIYVNTIDKLTFKLGGEAIIYVDDTNIVVKAPTLELAITKP